MNWATQTSTLELFARRLHFFGTAVAKTQVLLGVAGSCDDPWTPEFQRRAVDIYWLTLPVDYLARLASGFAGVALVIDSHSRCDLSEHPWDVLYSYFRSASHHIAVDLDATILPRVVEAADQDPTTPSAVRFDLLAREISAAGIADLIAAADTAVQSLLAGTPVDLRPEQLEWLVRLAEGQRVIDLAVSAGYSERSMYRLLKDLWKQMGVANLRQGVATAAESGWIEISS